jgi:signal transduction histidine kinase
VYAVGLAILAWGLQAPTGPVRFATHVFDLATFSTFVYLTEGPASPFVVYFVFALLAGALRWRWRGALWTGVVTLPVFLAIGVYAAVVLDEPHFQLDEFVIRIAYLAVVASFLCYLTAYEDARTGHMQVMATWPRGATGTLDDLLEAGLRLAGCIVSSSRIVLAWEEADEPAILIAEWDGRKVLRSSMSPADLPNLVHVELSGLSFLAEDGGADEVVLIRRGGGAKEWRGHAVHPLLASRYGMARVVCVPVLGETLDGQVFFLHGQSLTLDDVAAAELVAAEIGKSLDHHYLHKRLRDAKLATERVRLGRDLHDGVLQALTGARLQLRALASSIGQDVDRDRTRLTDLEQLIAAEQTELRTVIRELKTASTPPEAVSLSARLHALTERIERQWRLPVDLAVSGPFETLDDRLAQQVYLMVHEAVSNVARHAQASSADVTVTVTPDHVAIMVSDDGRGFPGETDHEGTKLRRLKRGPVSLSERVAALGGTLEIDSSDTGATLDISVPSAPVNP